MLRRERLKWVAIAWILCLTAISLQPYRPQGESESIVHRVAHVFAFGVAAFLPLVLSKGSRQAWMAVLGVVCLALAIETAQWLIYDDVLEWWDVRDDVIGIAVAVLLARRTRLRRLLLLRDGN